MNEEELLTPAPMEEAQTPLAPEEAPALPTPEEGQAAEPMAEKTPGEAEAKQKAARLLQAAFPEAAGKQPAPEVEELICAGVDPLAAMALFENHTLRQKLAALETARRNQSGPGSAAGLGGAPVQDPFLEGLNADLY